MLLGLQSKQCDSQFLRDHYTKVKGYIGCRPLNGPLLKLLKGALQLERVAVKNTIFGIETIVLRYYER